MNRHVTYVLLITVALFPSSCMCNYTREEHSEEEIEVNDLQTLTDVDELQTLTDIELEQLCTSRGFELVKETDKETGQKKEYSHNDYVEAAKQCLDMEAEMEQILSENPQMLDDIEAEAKKMREEKVRLERELAEAKSKLLKDEENNDTDSAFINKSAHERMINSETDDNISQNKCERVANDGDNEIIDLDMNAHKEAQMMNIPLSDNDTTYRANQEKPLGKDKSFVEYSAEHKATDSINLGEIIQDFRNQIREDMHRVGNMILPEHLRGPLMEALKPVIRISKDNITTTFDLLKKYVLIMLKNRAEQRDNEDMDEHIVSETAQN